MPDPPEPEVSAAKSRLRGEALKRRLDRAAPAEGARAARGLLTNFRFRADDCVAAYVAMRGEVDPAPVLEALAARGIASALPVVEGREQPLVFRRWSQGEALVAGDFKTLCPPASHAAVAPTVLIVPVLAFDRSGARLGYGGGFYDRTLARLRARSPIYAIGLAYAFQETETLPVIETDQRLDAIATDQEFFVIQERAP